LSASTQDVSVTEPSPTITDELLDAFDYSAVGSSPMSVESATDIPYKFRFQPQQFSCGPFMNVTTEGEFFAIIPRQPVCPETQIDPLDVNI